MVKTLRHPYCVYLAVSFGHWSSGHSPRSATGLSVANQHEIEFGACFWYNPDAGLPEADPAVKNFADSKLQ